MPKAAGRLSPLARGKSVAGRFIPYLLTVFFLISLNFFLPRLAPGDPVSALLASGNGPADQAVRQKVAHYYGLDRPISSQYFSYLGALGRGDLGISIQRNAPVTGLIAERLPWTLLLAGSAIAISTLVGTVAGIHSGWRRGRGLDRGLLAVFMSIRQFPVFFLGSLLLFVFAVKLRWVPLGGAKTAFSDSFGPLRRVADIAHHLVLPAGLLGIQFSAGHYLVMRAGMVGELGAGYLQLGKAKGLTERRLKYRYAARNALLPVVSVTALQLGFAVTITIFVETVFAYPGLGRLTFDALAYRDYPVLQGAFLVTTLAVVTINFLSDVLYRRLDPRAAV
ncbi:MAG: ABC transporter permease [Actinomycetota bacterium]